jgi:cell division protein FtsQ
MLDSPQVMRNLANALFLASALMLLYGALHYIVHLPVFPLRAVQLTEAPKMAEPMVLMRTVRSQVQGNFFTVDLESVRRAFEQVPWVRKVSVRRRFPWKLEVTIEEHVAAAHWNRSQLLNTYGEVFNAETEELLPGFYGQPDTGAEMLKMYGVFNKQLEPLHRTVTEIGLSPRHAWMLRLDNGMAIDLGREQMEPRLAHFIEVYPYTLAQVQGVRHVDLRYGNGFAATVPAGTGKQAGANKPGNKV